MDDKLAVIIAVTVITLAAMLALETAAETVITAAVSGLFGIAVGKKL